MKENVFQKTESSYSNQFSAISSSEEMLLHLNRRGLLHFSTPEDGNQKVADSPFMNTSEGIFRLQVSVPQWYLSQKQEM